MLVVLTGTGRTAASASPQVIWVGLLGCALATTLPSVPTMLTAYVSPVPWVTRTAYWPSGSGVGEGLGAADGEVPLVGLAVGEADEVGDAAGDWRAAALDDPHPARRTMATT